MSQPKKFACPCCGYLILEEEPPGTFEICPVCFWEDDYVQFKDPTYCCGANKVSLLQARQNFLHFGVSEEQFKQHVRSPLPEEVPPKPS